MPNEDSRRPFSLAARSRLWDRACTSAACVWTPFAAAALRDSARSSRRSASPLFAAERASRSANAPSWKSASAASLDLAASAADLAADMWDICSWIVRRMDVGSRASDTADIIIIIIYN